MWRLLTALLFGAAVGFALSFGWASIFAGPSGGLRQHDDLGDAAATPSVTAAPVRSAGEIFASLRRDAIVQQHVEECAERITGSAERRKLPSAVVNQIMKCAADFMPLELLYASLDAERKGAKGSGSGEAG